MKKKRGRLNKEGNVILFPDLDRRLTEKGLEALKAKNYRDAIQFLIQAKNLSPENEDIQIGLVLAYFESGNLVMAMDLAKEMLQMGIGEYIQVVDMYIMILVQQHQYEEIVSTVEALFEEKEVPADRFEHFSQILQFSKKMLQEKRHSPEEPSDPDLKETQELRDGDEPTKLDLFNIIESSDQVQMASMLANRNARSFIKEIEAYLQSDNGNPFFKTMLLNVLKEQDYDKEVFVEKFGRRKAFIPNQLFDIKEHPELKIITDKISYVLEQDNPMLLDGVQGLIERYFFLLYPFDVIKEAPEAWAAAFHFVTIDYFGQLEQQEDMAKLYDANMAEMTDAIALIKAVDEISPL